MSIPKETVDLILWDSRSLSVKELSQKHGVKEGTVRHLLSKNSITAKRPDPSRLLIPKEKLEHLLKDGWMGIRDMAVAFDCSYFKLKNSLVAHGILVGRKPHTRNRFREGNRSFKILGYIIANPEMSLSVVGQKFNCSREFVSQVDAMARKEGIIK